MKIKELQKKVADALNGVEALVQGGCKAFAEDTMGLGAVKRSQNRPYDNTSDSA